MTKYMWIIVIGFCVIIGCSYTGLHYYVTHMIRIIAYTSEQSIEDRNFNKVSSLHPGQGFIYHTHVNNYNPQCTGEYSLNLHNEKVDYQFNRVITRNIFKTPKTNFDINGFFNIPNDFPVGHYKFHQISFPRCVGVDVTPYQTNIDSEIDVIDGK